MTPVRRAFLKHTAAAAVSAPFSSWAMSQEASAAGPAPVTASPSPSPLAPTSAPVRVFQPRSGDTRTFEITTKIKLLDTKGPTRVWLPLPSVQADWQQSLGDRFTSNGQARVRTVGAVRLLQVDFAASEHQPTVELVSRVQTQSRAVDWSSRPASPQARKVSARELQPYLQATSLLPLDGIVHDTALQAIQGARTEVQKVRQIFDWVVHNTYREPAVVGCGLGDIKSMLETGNLGGKCADINALFVGLCRTVGIPARDQYGIRLARSAFGYKELGGNPTNLKAAQHCRAEVFLKDYGWVAMDPADVAKVMRQETAQWIKRTDDPVVAPVYQGLFGGWEGNWLAWNSAHDLRLPDSTEPMLGFFMYPQAETEDGRVDPYTPDDFQYQITASEVLV